MLIFAGVNVRALTDDLGDGYMGTQRAQGKRSLLPCSITLFTDPEHLNHQKDPLEEDHKGDGQRDFLLGGPWGNAHNSEDDGETCGPNGAVEESADCDWCMRGGRNETTKGLELTHIVTGNASWLWERRSVGDNKHTWTDIRGIIETTGNLVYRERRW